jgi:hypothetical protein
MSLNPLTIPFLRARVADPARRNAFALRVAERLHTAAVDYDQQAFGRWMEFFRRLCIVARPRVFPNLPADPTDLEVAAFLDAVASCARDSEIAAPSVALVGWSSYLSRGRRPSDPVGREWIGMAVDSPHQVDTLWIEDYADEHIGRDRCEACTDMFFGSEVVSVHDGGYVCRSCADRHYVFSARYDAWVDNDRAVQALDERGRVCVIHEDDDSFESHDDHDGLVHVDYQPPTVIRAYHASKPHQLPQVDDWTAEHNRYLGVELEVESTGARSKDAIAEDLHRVINAGQYGRRAFFERDGSLSDGFEIITQPMSLPALRSLFDFLRDPALVRGLRSHRTTTCGLHVHVSRDGLANGVIARAVTFVHAPENDAFLTALARRYGSSFCRYTEKVLETAALPGDRYEAVNLTGRNTIEFRIFRGSLKFEAVAAAIEFVHALLQYCARPGLTAAGLNASAFLSWCAVEMPSDTAILRDYVAQRAAGLFTHSEAA